MSTPPPPLPSHVIPPTHPLSLLPPILTGSLPLASSANTWLCIVILLISLTKRSDTVCWECGSRLLPSPGPSVDRVLFLHVSTGGVHQSNNSREQQQYHQTVDRGAPAPTPMGTLSQRIRGFSFGIRDTLCPPTSHPPAVS